MHTPASGYVRANTSMEAHTNVEILDYKGEEGAESSAQPNGGAMMVGTTAVNPCKDKLEAYFDCLGSGFTSCMSMSWIPSGSTIGDATCETLSSRNFCRGYNICMNMASYTRDACVGKAVDMKECSRGICSMLCPMMMMEEGGEGYEQLDILSEE